MSSPSQPLAVIAKLLDLTERRVQQLSRERLARTIRNRTDPEHEASIGAAAVVWSKAPAIVGAHARGALIRSRCRG